MRPGTGYALRPPLQCSSTQREFIEQLNPDTAIESDKQVPSHLVYKKYILKIHNLLSMVYGKTIKRRDIKAEIITELLSIQRDGSSLFKRQRQAEKIARLRKLGGRLSMLEHLILYQIEQSGEKEFLFNGTHIALILQSSRSEAEIKKLIELKEIIVQEKGDSYPAYFIKDMLVSFVFMDDPMSLLREIMNIDFAKVRFEIEQMPINTTREQFEQKYGDMGIWILKFFGRDFRSLRTIIRGYAKELLLLDIIPEAERVIAGPGSVEDEVEKSLLRDSLDKVIGRLRDREQEVVQMFLEGYSEEEIYSKYPDVSLPEVFGKLRVIIIGERGLLDSIAPFYESTMGQPLRRNSLSNSI